MHLERYSGNTTVFCSVLKNFGNVWFISVNKMPFVLMLQFVKSQQKKLDTSLNHPKTAQLCNYTKFRFESHGMNFFMV